MYYYTISYIAPILKTNVLTSIHCCFQPKTSNIIHCPLRSVVYIKYLCSTAKLQSNLLLHFQKWKLQCSTTTSLPDNFLLLLYTLFNILNKYKIKPIINTLCLWRFTNVKNVFQSSVSLTKFNLKAMLTFIFLLQMFVKTKLV